MRPRSLTAWPFLRAQSRMAPACWRSMRPPVARERPPPDARFPRATLRAAETYRERASRMSLAFSSARSISYDVPSRAKLTVSSADRFSSRSSDRMTCTLRAILSSSLLATGLRRTELAGRGTDQHHCTTRGHNYANPWRVEIFLFTVIRPRSVPLVRPRRTSSADWPDEREEDRFADSEAGQGHHEPIHAHAHAAGRGHAVLQGLQEVLVQRHGLGIPGRGEQGLGGEAFALRDGVDELGVGGRPLHATDVQVPLLGQAR